MSATPLCIVVAARAALAVTLAPTEASAAPASEQPWTAEHDPVIGPAPTRQYARRINRNLRGVGLGYDNGLWGRDFAQGLKVDIPFGRRVGQFFGLRMRGVWVHSESDSMGDDVYDPVGLGGLELFGRTPVVFGILRLYGGGGAWFGGRALPTADGKRYWFGGGGHFGFEAVVTPRVSFTIEIGGQSAAHGLGHDGGPSIMGGMMIYFGGLGEERR